MESSNTKFHHTTDQVNPEVWDVLLLRRKLDLLLRTGKLLMESAADTNRIERNMKRVAAFMNILEEKLHIDIRWTMIMVNVSDEQHSFSKFQKCENHAINMTMISQISKLSFKATEENYSLDDYEKELENIIHTPRNYTPYLVAIGAGFACGGFCKLFGSDWIAFLFASICAFIGFRVRARCMKTGINVYMSIGIAAFVSTCLAYASSFSGLSSTPYNPLLACALFIVPGVPLINFVDDMIDNHLLVGITRAANTIMMIGAMTFGIAFAMRILIVNDLNINQKINELSIVPHDSYLVYALAAAIAAMGFSMILTSYRFIHREFHGQPYCRKSHTLVSCSQPRTNHSLCHSYDSGSINVSLVIRLYRTSWGNRRSYQRLLQWRQFSPHHSLYFTRCSHPEYCCTAK